jgi:hypothetical protein
MVKFLQSSLLKIAMAAMALIPVGICFSAETVSAAETTQAYTIKPEANAKGVVRTISPIIVTFDNATTVVPNTSVPKLTYGFVEYNAGDEGWIEVLSGEQIFGNSIHYFVIDSAIQDGEFKLTIPAGTYLVDGVPNEEITKTFIYKEAPQVVVVVTPAEGEVESLQEFTIEFQGAEEVTAAFSREAYPVLYNVTGGHNEFSWTSGSVDGNKLTLKTNAAVSYVGEYELRIPGASYTVEGDTGEDLVFAYKIVPSAKTFEYEVTPAADEDGNVSTISPITIKFPNALAVADNPNADYWTQYATLEYNSPRAGWNEIPAEIQLQSNTILVFVEEQDQIDGEFKLTIPAGTYLADGGEIPEIVETFNYVAPVDKTVYQVLVDGVVLSEEGVEVEAVENNVSVKFINATEVTVDESDYWTYPYVSINSEKVGWIESGDFGIGEANGNEVVFTINNKLEGGEYQINIPAGLVAVDGETIANEITFKFSVAVPPISTTITPAEGTVKSLSEFDIVFNDIALVALDNYTNDTRYYIETEAGIRIYSTDAYINYTVEGDPLHIEFNDITTDGNYTLVLPAGSYKVNGLPGEELRFNYTISSVDKTEYQVVIDGNVIEEGAEVAGVKSGIVVKFPNATEVTVDESDYWTYPLVNFNSAKWGWDESGDFGYAGTDGNEILFDVYGSPEGGEYEVYIPAGIVTVDGETISDEIALRFTVKVVVPEFTTTINPAEGTVQSLSTFDIVFNGVSTIQSYNFYSDTQFYIEDQDGNKTYSNEAYVNYDATNGSCPLHIEFSKITEAGKYTLVLPAGSYKVDGVAGNELRFNYTISATDAISSIFVDGVESVDVYDLRGVRVLSNAKAQDIRNLNTNVYIINGQKYLIRK